MLTTTILSDQSLSVEMAPSRPISGDLFPLPGYADSSALGDGSGENCRNAGCIGAAPGQSMLVKSVILAGSKVLECLFRARRADSSLPISGLAISGLPLGSSPSMTPPGVPELFEDMVCDDIWVPIDSDEGRRRSGCI